MNVTQALEIVVSLSQPGKIPAPGYSISAFDCITGSKLVKVKGSVCEGCYALKGWYPKRKVIQDTFQKRLASINHPFWVNAMVYLITRKKLAFFRWHDSGDLQGLYHLDKIVQIAWLCPSTKFWLPTREYEMVKEYVEGNHGIIPDNLCIRLSGHMVDGEPPAQLAKSIGVQVSSVSARGNEDCPAHLKTYITSNGQKKEWKGYCGSCRNCWNTEIFEVTYKKH